MRKKTAILVLSVGLSVLTAVPAFASGWQKNETGWWYGTNADNSTWYSNGWQWIDGNGDGIAECYYFDVNGYMAENTVVDGYTVNVNGAWTVNGVVQTKQVGAQVVTQPQENSSTWPDGFDPFDMNNQQAILDKYFGGGGISGVSGDHPLSN